MAIYIKTGECPETTLPDDQGRARQIMNRELCGAETGVVTIRTLGPGEAATLAGLPASKQLVYVMNGAGVITLGEKRVSVGPGAGLYLEEGESAAIAQDRDADLVAVHVVVPPATD